MLPAVVLDVMQAGGFRCHADYVLKQSSKSSRIRPELRQVARKSTWRRVKISRKEGQNMRCLYVAELPLDVEELKSTDKRATINGGLVAHGEFCKALVDYSRFDRIVFPRQPRAEIADLRNDCAFKQQSDRIRFVNLGELAGLTNVEIVYCSTSWNVPHLMRLRANSSIRSIPVSGTVHSLCSPEIFDWATQMVFANFATPDFMACTSRAAKQALEKIFDLVSSSFRAPEASRSFPVIPLGIKIPELVLKRNHKPCPTVLYIGRFSFQSKADLLPLLIAWSRIKAKVASCRLILAGDDTQSNLSPQYRDIAQLLGCSESVEIKTNISTVEKHDLLVNADVFVSPSDNMQESFGLSILEAMAFGLPVVASDWSGYRDIVEDGVSGYLIPTLFWGSVATCGAPLSAMLSEATALDLSILEARITALIRRPDLAHSMGGKARWIVQQKYCWQSVIKQYDEQWFESLVVSSKTGRDTRKDSMLEWSPQELFGQYASTLLEQDDLVSVTEHLLESEFRVFSRRFPSLIGLARQVLSACPYEGIQVSSLCEKIENVCGSVMCYRVIMALLKYGILQRHSDKTRLAVP